MEYILLQIIIVNENDNKYIIKEYLKKYSYHRIMSK